MMTENDSPLYTCLSCSIAFTAADEQRTHYRSDHHRYNMKRRVAGLPPISSAVFNQKVLDRRAETAIMVSPKGSTCKLCSKSYTTENAYRSHLQSKRHKENEIKSSSQSQAPVEETTHPAAETDDQPLKAVSAKVNILSLDEDASEEQIEKAIDDKIAAARSRLSTEKCLFCAHESTSLQENLDHMALSHSFFIPDTEYLTDLQGLITYLGEKIAVGNVCIYCNNGREFRTIDAVRKHMVDKAHCKIGYNSESDRLELSDFYDFSNSYPDASRTNHGGDEWEDVDEADDGSSVDEIVDEDGSSESDSEDVSKTNLAYGDTPYELILPSGARIAHRSMRRYYTQSFSYNSARSSKRRKSGADLTREMLADKNSALVPRKGAFGAYGTGAEVLKARNPGEAREAGRHVREFRDQKRRENFKTKVGFRNNHQKHFRDPLLQ